MGTPASYIALPRDFRMEWVLIFSPSVSPTSLNAFDTEMRLMGLCFARLQSTWNSQISPGRSWCRRWMISSATGFKLKKYVVPATGRYTLRIAPGTSDPRATVAVTHGGNNGVTEALSAGVPLLVLPFSTDQFAVAADLERTGLGRAADPNAVTAAEIREGVLALLDGPSAGAAAALGTQLRSDPGPARARRAVAALLSGS